MLTAMTLVILQLPCLPVFIHFSGKWDNTLNTQRMCWSRWFCDRILRRL